MKINEIIQEDVAQLKRDVIHQVTNTNDEDLLDRIYTVLNKTNLEDRISGTLSKETDTSGFVDAITKIIIDTPGTYNEKYKFIDAFPEGYVNINLMLAGNRVKFEDLLTAGVNKDVPIGFVRRVFAALKSVTFGTVKGPGEFALAALSPHIKITGKGDLNIGDDVIEVKASAGKDVSSGGGRLGNPGFLNHQDVAKTIRKYIPTLPQALSTSGGNLGLDGLLKLSMSLPEQKRTSLGRELFNSIFGGKADVSELVSALANGQSLLKPYIKANYAAYQKDSNFSGIMIMNFALGELRYYKDPAVMADEVYNPAVYIISKKEADAARQILSQVTLRPFKEPPITVPALPADQTASKVAPANETPQLRANVEEFAQKLVQSRGVTDPGLVAQIVDSTMSDLVRGVDPKKILPKLVKKYPQLNKKQQPVQLEPENS